MLVFMVGSAPQSTVFSWGCCFQRSSLPTWRFHPWPAQAHAYHLPAPCLCLLHALPHVSVVSDLAIYSHFICLFRLLLCSWSFFLLPLTASPVLSNLQGDHLPSVNKTALLMYLTINSASCFATALWHWFLFGYLIIPWSFYAVLVQEKNISYFCIYAFFFFINCSTQHFVTFFPKNINFRQFLQCIKVTLNSK